mmetsp:Transcript_20857/g.53801  ORF Transcript_20857/g.53801 Transcript_20857/m.53801 type:complete len:338 (+) Transcript_20857:57-1070(+)|eukprot:CAMPEP_0119405850 /NCGR_PEP_ID=MMETSP1335-20130426/395_1 /TAXON_ID=259385 /ORGANISM="Chrysoculter rhomboideus, Strain RCC1486" /LENGTH=337 /DNA_ID=CAMNT_0007429895 /DNA_START=41 /DNA_END=1054 /DNA_ORIENTATION=+
MLRLPVMKRRKDPYEEAMPRVQKRVRELVAAVSTDSQVKDLSWTAGIKPESLVLAVAYLGRLIASVDSGLRERDTAAKLAAQASLHFATCVVLADKFCNDKSYDNLLLLVADAAHLDARALRRAEVATLSALLDTSGLMIDAAEFTAVACVVNTTPWTTLGADMALDVLASTTRKHVQVLPAGAVVTPLVSAGVELEGSAVAQAAISDALHALGSIIGRVRKPFAAAGGGVDAPPATAIASMAAAGSASGGGGSSSSSNGADNHRSSVINGAVGGSKTDAASVRRTWVQRMRVGAPATQHPGVREKRQSIPTGGGIPRGAGWLSRTAALPTLRAGAA